MTTAIIDYQSGNLRSAEKSFARAAREAGLDDRIIVTAEPEVVRAADRIVLPGVGAFADCRAGLLAVPGLFDAVEEAVREGGKPFFGICVGMQLLATLGLEYGETPGFGWIPGQVGRITPDDPALKIPHMGWNALSITRAHPVFQGVAEGDHAYFVHSYHLNPDDEADRIATVGYGQAITAAVARDTIIGTQFHPEKSQRVGLTIIRNFLTWAP